MSKATVHARSSAKRFGGKPEDYQKYHDWFDQTKSVVADNRHRAILHNAWVVGPDGLLEQVFGKTMINSDGREVSVRDIGEQHIREDHAGHIPTLQDFLGCMTLAPFMSGVGRPPSAVRPGDLTQQTIAAACQMMFDTQAIIDDARARGCEVTIIGDAITISPAAPPIGSD